MTSIGKNADALDRKNYAFGKIEDASTHLLGIINDILDMSKIEAGKFELSVVEFNLEKMLQKVSDVMAFRMDEKKQKFVVRIDRGIPGIIAGDDQRLSQILANLLSNAAKFTPEGGTIYLNAMYVREEGERLLLRFEVRDTGIGISPEQQARLFKSFQQAEGSTTRKYGGTGLGLAISKRIVEMMDGDIWIDSELGKGATFTFTTKVKRCKTEAPRPQGINMETVRVLFVDDMAEVREYFHNIALQFGFRCDVAGTPDEAMKLVAKNGPYDMCFIDWMMADANRSDLPRRVQEQGGEKTITIAMIPMASRGSMESETKAEGITGYISKPLFPSAVANCIAEYLGSEVVEEEEECTTITDRFEKSHILLVEDVEINQEIVIALLEPTQLTIDCADNGEAAVDMYCKNPDTYDMIFMDLQMPVMDGFKATQLIREFEQGRAGTTADAKKVPIIAMTANVFREDIERCIAVGMDGHVGKPLDPSEVIKILRKYLA
jgi:CheY-like chemotaxis protein